MSDLLKTLQNMGRATSELKDYLTIQAPSKVERAGIIQGFEFCYELFWKAFQKKAASEGLIVGSPKQSIKSAFAMGIIKDEALWLKMIDDRNLTVHTYNEALSIEIYLRVRSLYAKEFDRCLADLKSRINEP